MFLDQTLKTLANLQMARQKGYDLIAANGRSFVYNFNYGAGNNPIIGFGKVVIPHACGVPQGDYRLAELALGHIDKIKDTDDDHRTDHYVCLEQPFTLPRAFVKTATDHGQNGSRPWLEGIYLDQTNMVFTNGHVLLMQKHKRELQESFFVPNDILKMALKIFRGTDIQVARLPKGQAFPSSKPQGGEPYPVIEVSSPLTIHGGVKIMFELIFDLNYADYRRVVEKPMGFLDRTAEDQRRVTLPTLAELVHQQKLREAKGDKSIYTAIELPALAEYEGKNLGFGAQYLKVLAANGIKELFIPKGEWTMDCAEPCIGAALPCHPHDGLLAVLMPMRK